jgi:septal ring factor EnvC (AmiA/AmiB activator)
VQLRQINTDMIHVQRAVSESQDSIRHILKARYYQSRKENQPLLDSSNAQIQHRAAHYHQAISTAQYQLMQDLQKQLDALNDVANQIRQKQIELNDLTRQQQQKSHILEAEQQRKSLTVATLSQEMQSKKNRLEQLLANEKNLTNLINKLNRIQQAQKRTAKKTVTLETSPLTKSIATKSLAPPLPDRPGKEGGVFAALKGKLSLPVAGTITARFGEPRAEGTTWKGIFIQAQVGQSVKAIAEGKIVFAQWLRGFGNMIIVDHGEGYMSLYGQNESLIKQVGALVKKGEPIALVGHHAESQEAGVYLEIRRYGQPQNPLKWALTA